MFHGNSTLMSWRRGAPGETSPLPLLRFFFVFVFTLILPFTIPTWYYFENKSNYLVFTLHNHEYTSNELLFLLFLFYFYIFRDVPPSPMNFPRIWGCLHMSTMCVFPLLPFHVPKTWENIEL